MSKILSSVACNLDVDILLASLPLFEESKIEAIEWSFDALFKTAQIPLWFYNLLKAFSDEKRLIGHGIFFSLFSGRFSDDQKNWLKQLKEVSTEFSFDHVTEHFGFMTGQNFHHGAPLNIPYSKTNLEIGRDRLARIYDACRCPVGLENLAFSYSIEEVKQHGEFLEKLIEPINGFIILDIHNLYCQIHNFSISFETIIQLYPLERVREIHVSGGSWEDSAIFPEKKIRRDTHDSSVPEEVFNLLEVCINKCPNLKYVVLEQLGNGLKTETSKKLFFQDFLRLEKIVQQKNKNITDFSHHPFLPKDFLLDSNIVKDEILYQQQIQLSNILETSNSYEDAIHRLNKSTLANSDWKIENWEPHMIETAICIAQKWKC